MGLLLILLLIFLLPIRTTQSLEWQVSSGYRWAKLPVPEIGKAGFSLLEADKTRITFSNRLQPEQIAENRFLLGGSGVATGDIDGDGLTDLYFCGLDTTNFLYRNLGGWKFEDITDQAGVACPNRFSTGATFADIDGDGDLDLLVTALGGPNACFINNGDGKFTEATQQSGLSSDKGSTSMALADIEGDGDLDLYITNFKKISVESLYAPRDRLPHQVTKKVGDAYEVVEKFKEHYRVELVAGQPVLLENAEQDVLYINNGKGRFEPAAAASGRFRDPDGKVASGLMDWGLLPRFHDMDHDGDPDLYVCNDYSSPDRIWVNDGAGYFQAIAPLAVRHTSRFTMAVDFSDINRDGYSDFMLIDMLAQDHQRRVRQMNPTQRQPTIIGQFDDRPQIKRNTLFLNRGDNSYAEIGQLSGVQASEWTWSIRFLDVDLDGFEDIITTNGQLHDFEDADTNDRVQRLAMLGHDYRQLAMLYPQYLTPNVAFRNQGDLAFRDVSEEWGFTTPDLAWGMAFADFDLDGDLDIATNRLDDPAGVYRNEGTANRIAVRLRGLPPNTQGVGAKIRLLGGPVTQEKEVICGGTYLSGSDPLVTFGASRKNSHHRIEVTWRSGKLTRIDGVLPNRIYEISEPETQLEKPDEAVTNTSQPIFEDVSHLIDHRHHEVAFDDFERQPLLPNRLSQQGPGVAWHDFDGDNRDDLIIASGKGGQLALFRNVGTDGFSLTDASQVCDQDQTAIVGWKGNRVNSILLGCSNYENEQPSEAFIARHDFADLSSRVRTKIPFDKSSTGPVAMADYDGDGDLDLFVGGRSLPGRYPEPATSKLYLNERNQFKPDRTNSERLNSIGLVSGAVFSDFDGDGDPDLILALEWGALTVLRNDDGHFNDDTVALGLDRYHGWWNGVTTGDLDEDGDLDIIATNWGQNDSHYSESDSLRVYYGDFDGNGSRDILQVYFDSESQAFVPKRSLAAVIKAIPIVRPRTPTNKIYAESSVQDVLGESINNAKHLQVNTLAHTVFFNHGDRFEASPLPREAQFAPAFYVGIADYDGDGHDDIFISQNFFATNPEADRQDAGRGLWLKGNGTGQLHPIPGHESGVMVYGEQRGAALGDYDKDGRIDLAVSQNGAETKLYRNARAKPGLRVRLHGPSDNPAGIGAVLRLIYEDR
ncbi:VCBS repeat-containing protein, partial [bacterium]|nr:VCBS repeat-containing protein [bacterium]